MDIAIDTSAIIAVISNEPERERIIELTSEADLIAPGSVHWEIGNAFSAMLRRGRITLQQSNKAVELYEQIPIRYVDIELIQSLQIASALGIYAYDAYIIRCAQKYNSPLLTLDNYLGQAAKQMEVDVLEIVK